jgi:hypothetical protein
VTVYFGPSDDVPKEDLLLYLPRTATKPVPVFLALNFSGNHAVINDPAVRLATIWRRVPNPHREASSPSAHHQETAKEETRGRDKSFPVEQILDRGYGFATIYYQDIEPDFQDGVEYSVRKLFPSVTGDDAWGAIGAWAYGLSRAMDYLETERGVDAKRIAIMGHSRLGKTALWEGAIEPRTAMVIASCPGEGGASLARRNYGETLRDTTRYWFAANLARYADDPNKLPVDMHELIALSAPRPVYITGAEDDRWADPKGEFLAEVAAGPVFRLLGQRDLGTSEWPPLNQPIMATLAYHYREGKHEVTPFDWEQFLKFADMHFHR